MSPHYFRNTYLLILTCLMAGSCNRETAWEGQEPIKEVSTLTVPVQLQHKGTFDLGEGIFMTNEFEGARLNGAARLNDTVIAVLITPENMPINTSPWYSFKVWSETSRMIYIKLTYPNYAYHRYFPKMSHDGLNWAPVDSANYAEEVKKSDQDNWVPVEAIVHLNVGPDTLWISAQELITSWHVGLWMDQLDTCDFVSTSTIGETVEGRPIPLLRIGNSDDQRMNLIISRQHPPEISGYLAMQAFVEALCSEGEIAQQFRDTYNTYIIPMANPDGVYHGHWRHNKAGIDLNRDWAAFNQPETSAIRDFLRRKTAESGGRFFVGIDFHSTQEDIYYTMPPGLKGNMPGLILQMIEATGNEFEGYEPNIRPGSEGESRVTSTDFLFYEFGIESLTYEVGDHTPRDFVRAKAEMTAIKLMGLMLENRDTLTEPSTFR